MECYACEEKVGLPFKCKFCGNFFCEEHRLPENHECPGLSDYKEKKHEEIKKAVPVKIVYSPSKVSNQKKPGFKQKIIDTIQKNPNLYIGIILIILLIITALIP